MIIKTSNFITSAYPFGMIAGAASVDMFNSGLIRINSSMSGMLNPNVALDVLHKLEEAVIALKTLREREEK